LYEEDGDRCVEQLQGMFALAIYDSTRSSLFLARDRFGKKPLFYTETAKGFYFGSEILPLLKLTDLPRQADREAIDAYLTLGYIPTPRTAWSGVQRLPEGHTLWVRSGKGSIPESYWRLSWANSVYEGIREGEVLQGVRERLEESVRMRLVADVPLGAFLSGGIDSSVMVAAMTRVGGRPKTFCIGFDEPRFDETSYAQKVAQHLQTEHYSFVVKPDSLDDIGTLLDSLGEPFGDQSILPTYSLAKWTRGHVTVALSGDGGDEWFGGYKRYQHLTRVEHLHDWHLQTVWKFMSYWGFTFEQFVNPSRRNLQWPRSATDQILGLNVMDGYLHLRGGWDVSQKQRLWKSRPNHDLAEHSVHDALTHHPGLSGLSRWQALDVETYLADDILRKVDVASMACSLECRCPFLDHHLAEFVAGIPEEYKSVKRFGRHPLSKRLLRNLYPDVLPVELFDREKKGFSMPLGPWIRGAWKDAFEDSIRGTWSPGLESTYERTVLEELWSEHQKGIQDHGQRLWNWWMLYQWDQRFRPQWAGANSQEEGLDGLVIVE
jgi:asparagine synthase (glutamine-hydrolysing)